MSDACITEVSCGHTRTAAYDSLIVINSNSTPPPAQSPNYNPPLAADSALDLRCVLCMHWRVDGPVNQFIETATANVRMGWRVGVYMINLGNEGTKEHGNGGSAG